MDDVLGKRKVVPGLYGCIEIAPAYVDVDEGDPVPGQGRCAAGLPECDCRLCPRQGRIQLVEVAQDQCRLAGQGGGVEVDVKRNPHSQPKRQRP
ncbi:hypothetical protein ABZT45_46725 [Streptomyces sp. NPDC005356]|uniref:hypothetical protein n=1 Tax=unclassified Streptomyces TaxID=2593676 RepID=UPI0033A712F0